jgi:hypothetical protein
MYCKVSMNQWLVSHVIDPLIRNHRVRSFHIVVPEAILSLVMLTRAETVLSVSQPSGMWDNCNLDHVKARLVLADMSHSGRLFYAAGSDRHHTGA